MVAKRRKHDENFKWESQLSISFVERKAKNEEVKQT